MDGGTTSRIWIGLAVLGLEVAAIPEAQAIIRRDDVADARYLVDDADYPAFVDLFGPGDCIGTLVHESYLLTVAHCAADLSVGDELKAGRHMNEVAEVLIHPKWKDDDADNYDIALVRLSEPVRDVDPVPLYRGEDELGAVVTIFGRGMTGTGLEGEPGAHDDGKLRHATNVVTAAGTHFLEITFEAPGEDGITDLEGVGAAGDSGGPVFVDVGGVPFLAGLNAWGDGWDCTGVGQYGAADYQTRITHYTDWLDAQVDTWPAPPSLDADAVVLHSDVVPPRADPDACGCAVGSRDTAMALLLPLLGLGLPRRRRSLSARRGDERGGPGSGAPAAPHRRP